MTSTAAAAASRPTGAVSLETGPEADLERSEPELGEELGESRHAVSRAP